MAQALRGALEVNLSNHLTYFILLRDELENIYKTLVWAHQLSFEARTEYGPKICFKLKSSLNITLNILIRAFNIFLKET